MDKHVFLGQIEGIFGLHNYYLACEADQKIKDLEAEVATLNARRTEWQRQNTEWHDRYTRLQRDYAELAAKKNTVDPMPCADLDLANKQYADLLEKYNFERKRADQCYQEKESWKRKAEHLRIATVPKEVESDLIQRLLDSRAELAESVSALTFENARLKNDHRLALCDAKPIASAISLLYRYGEATGLGVSVYYKPTTKTWTARQFPLDSKSKVGDRKQAEGKTIPEAVHELLSKPEPDPLARVEHNVQAMGNSISTEIGALSKRVAALEAANNKLLVQLRGIL